MDKAATAAQILSGGETSSARASMAEPARNISLRIAGDNSSALEVRVIDRGGEVRVAVRSPDTAVAETVRAGLPELVERLGQRGFETEVWRPAAARSGDAGETRSSRESPDGGAFGRGGEESRGGREPRNPQPENQPAWLEELDNHLKTTANRSAFSWSR
jgi:hypothetical protein